MTKSRSRPADEHWVWGVDVGLLHTYCVAVKRGQAFGFALPPHVTQRPKGLDLPNTLKLKREGLLSSISSWLASARPLAIFVETPMGRVSNPPLTAAYGVTLEALAHMTTQPVCPVNISDWKKAYPGFGNAGKEQLVTAAANDGFTHAVQDAVDAYCIARAGALMISG